MDILTLINTALGTAKELKKWSDTVQDTQVKLLVANLLSEIADIKVECATLKTESIDYKNKIAELEEVISKKEDMEYDSSTFGIGVYFKKSDKAKEEPLCQVCYDQLGLISHINSIKPPHGGHYLQCKVCNFTHTLKVNPLFCEAGEVDDDFKP